MYALQFLIRYFYAPAFFLGFMFIAMTLVQGGQSYFWLYPLLIGAIAVSFIAEFILPYEKKWNHSKGDLKRDIIHAIVNAISIMNCLIILHLMITYLPNTGLWPKDWPLWVQLAMAIVIADFGIMMCHYLCHKKELLWRIHAPHHSIQRMYGFNGLMKHPLSELIETLAGTTPLLLLGMPLDVGVLLGFAVGIQLLLQHSNVDMRVGPLVYVWCVAPVHRHHHLGSAKDGDVNFGLFTNIWDHMLGTFVWKRPMPKDGDLGIDGDPNYPVEYVDQLIEPFKGSRAPNQETTQKPETIQAAE